MEIKKSKIRYVLTKVDRKDVDYLKSLYGVEGNCVIFFSSIQYDASSDKYSIYLTRKEYNIYRRLIKETKHESRNKTNKQ